MTLHAGRKPGGKAEALTPRGTHAFIPVPAREVGNTLRFACAFRAGGTAYPTFIPSGAEDFPRLPNGAKSSAVRIPALLRLELVTEEVIGNAGPQQGGCVLIGAEVDSSVNARIRDVIGDLLKS